MIKITIAAITLCLASCAGFPFSIGISTDEVEAEYSAKGGLVIIVDIDSSK